MSRIMQWAEFKPLLEESVGVMADYSIGFINLRVEKNREEGVLGGSGTLVASGNSRAILTAEHVLQNLPNSGTVGFIAMTRHGPRVHQFVVHMDRVRKLPIARGTNDADGPDLGLVVLAQPEIHKLEAQGKVFYNLANRRERMLNSPPANELGAWILCGIAHEWTRDAPPGRFDRVKEFRGTCGLGVLAGQREADGFDYLRFEAKYDAAYEGPESYEGFSGGGLWQLLVEERDGLPRVKELLLQGVTFYQHERVAERRVIECHGRRSVYEVAAGALAKAAS